MLIGHICINRKLSKEQHPTALREQGGRSACFPLHIYFFTQAQGSIRHCPKPVQNVAKRSNRLYICSTFGATICLRKGSKEELLSMKKNPRTANIKQPAMALKSSLELAVLDFIDVEGNKLGYTEVQMHGGVDIPKLLVFKVMLVALMVLDPRGGYFFQEDLAQGLKLVMDENQVFAEKVQNMAISLRTNPMGILERLAYMIRVMCAHVRIKFRQHLVNKKETSPLQPIFEVIQETNHLPSRPASDGCPMPAFRDAAEGDSDGDVSAVDDGVCVIAQYWDGDPNIMAAIQLMSDGSLKEAEWYEHGPNGMVQACFGAGAALELEIPNMCLNERGKIDTSKLEAPPIPRPRKKAKVAGKFGRSRMPKKRPATTETAVNAAEVAAEEEEAAPPAKKAKKEEAAEPPKKKIRLVCVKTHKPNHYAVQRITQRQDKAQLIEFKASLDQRDLIFKSYQDLLTPIIPDIDTVKTIPADILWDIRAVCRKHREQSATPRFEIATD